MAQAKYISLTNLQLYDSLLKQYVTKKDSEALKTVSISGNELRFYNVPEPMGSTEPVFTIELPETDVSGFLQKLTGATEGNIITAGTGGAIQDSGIKASDLPTKAEMDTAIAKAAAESTHLKKQVVLEVPAAADAKEDVLYYLKKEGTAGADKYEIWTKIGDAVVMIDDTSIDLSGYMAKADVEAAIAAAKQEAITAAAADAKTKADGALADAKAYADQEVGKANASISGLTSRVTANEAAITATNGSIASANASITSQGERITALENAYGDGLEEASEEDIRGLFPA